MTTEVSLGRGIRDEINPEADLRQQLQKNARLFAPTLGISRQEYIARFPEFKHEPEDIGQKLGIIVPVETEVPLPEMLRILGIDTFFDPQEVEDWLVEEGFETPSKPYVTRLTYIPNKSALDTRVDLLKQENKRGGTIFDGIALCLKNPQILNRYYLNFPGSQVGPDDVPFLFAWSNSVENSTPSPILSYGNVESASPKFACLVASKV